MTIYKDIKERLMYFGSDIKKKPFSRKHVKLIRNRVLCSAPFRRYMHLISVGRKPETGALWLHSSGKPFSHLLVCFLMPLFFNLLLFCIFFLSSTSCPLSLYTLISSFYFLFPAFSGREMLKVLKKG